MVDVGTVDVEEFAGSHIICVDHREVRDPIWREDGLVSREELVAHLHHELHVERDGDWPPGPRALQLFHFRFPGRCGVEKVVGSAGFVWEAARDEAKLDDGVEGSLITGVIHHSGELVPHRRAFRHRGESGVNRWVVNLGLVEVLIKSEHRFDHGRHPPLLHEKGPMALNGPDPHWCPSELSGRQAVHLDPEASHR